MLFLAKLNVSVTVALLLFYSPPSPLNFSLFYYLCVSVRLCGGERLTDTALVAIFMVHYNKSL